MTLSIGSLSGIRRMRPGTDLGVDGPPSFRSVTRRRFSQKCSTRFVRTRTSAAVTQEPLFSVTDQKAASSPKSVTISPYAVHALFAGFLFVILGFAAVDTYLNIEYPVKDKVEENPVAKWVLQHSHNDLGLLIALKLIGTNLAIALLTLYYRHKKGMALVASGSVAFIVTIMLMYMVIS